MNTVGSFLSQESLDDLTRLEQRAELLVSQQVALQEQLQRLRALQARIVRLRARRDQLKAAQGAKYRRKGPLECLLHRKLPKRQLSDEEKHILLRRHKLEEVKAAYRLLGRSLSVISEDKVRVCLDTSCYSEFFPPHYAELRVGAGHPPTLTRHTLPPFVPLGAVRTALETTGISGFMHLIQQYLHAFQIRKKFAIIAQEDWSAALAEDVRITPVADWISLHLVSVPQCGGASVILQLRYDDLMSWRPTRVKVTIEDDESKESATTEKDAQLHIDDLIELAMKNDLPQLLGVLVG